MILTRKSVDRRTFLRGLGAAVALPMLDAMVPAFAVAGPRNIASAAPVRFGFVYVPNGIIMDRWVPAAEGTAFDFPRILKPVERFREHLLLINGLAHHEGNALGDGPGDHARAAATILTGVHPKKTQGADILLAHSADQIAASEIGKNTQLPSLELGLENSGMVGNCDSGYSCAYSNSISWRGPTMPMPPEINPRAVFERLFGDGDTTDPGARAALARQNRSILDFVRADTARLDRHLGQTDRRKLSEYLEAIRDIELRIEKAEQTGFDQSLPEMERPSGIPLTFEDHAKLMFDMQVIAFQADLTRVITFMLGREGSNQTYRAAGVPEAHHGLSHHQNDPEKIEKLTKINTHHIELFSYFLEKLQATADGEGTLLDNSMILYGSGLSDGNKHLHEDLPVLLAGGHGSPKLRSGCHLRYPSNTPMMNLYLTLLDKMGVEPEKIGDSTGKVEHLSEVTA